MKREFPKDYEALEAVRLYLTRSGVVKYRLDAVSRWVCSTTKDVDSSSVRRWYYEGTFADCLIQFMRDDNYFNEWVDACMDQVCNCNNGTLIEFCHPRDPDFTNVSLGFGNSK